MTLSHLARSNIRGNWLRYAAFVLSNTFSVLLFSMYAQFLMHPDLATGYLYGGATTRSVLLVCMALVVVFALFFVLYSSGAFLRSRHQEFGLLTLMGTTRRQLRRLIWLEHTFLSTAAIAAGLGLGLLLSKLFLLAISRVLALSDPIRFAFVPRALVVTAVAFFLLFQLVTLVSAARVGRRSVIDLLHAARRPRTTPRSSAALAVVGLLFVAGGYVGAASVKGTAVALAFLPTVTAVVIGTYLLFTHGSQLVLSRLKRPGGGYLRGTRLLVVSQLVFRLRDNARLLATIATLSAVVLSAAGTFYVITRQVALAIDTRFVQPLALLATSSSVADPGTPDGLLTVAAVDAMLAAHGVTPTLREALPVLQGEMVVDERRLPVVYTSRSAYDALLERTGADARLGSVLSVPAADPAAFGAAAFAAQAVTPPVSPVPLLWGEWYLVDDGDLAALAAMSPAGTVDTLYLYDWPGATRLGTAGGAAAASISAAAAPAYDHLIADRYGAETELRQVLGLSMFAGVFVSLLFFIGAGSLVYFKLFTELPDDRRLFTRLRRIGITRSEADRVVTAQVALVFLLPFAVGGVHALVALNSLGNLLMVNVVGYSLLVVGLFAAVQLLFLALTRWTYLRALLPAR